MARSQERARLLYLRCAGEQGAAGDGGNMNYQNIRVEKQEALAVITVSRETALNALNSSVLDELINAVAELELDDAVRVVALTGAGDKAFVAGADIAEM